MLGTLKFKVPSNTVNLVRSGNCINDNNNLFQFPHMSTCNVIQLKLSN